MNRVCTEHLTSGMILAKAVMGLDGNALLESGLVLTADHLQMLADMGVSPVFARYPAKADVKEESLRQVQAYVRNFFIYVDPDHEAFQELYRIAVQRTLNALHGGWIMPCEDELRAKNVEHLSDFFLKDTGTPADIVRHKLKRLTVD